MTVGLLEVNGSYNKFLLGFKQCKKVLHMVWRIKGGNNSVRICRKNNTFLTVFLVHICKKVPQIYVEYLCEESH